MKIWWFCIPAYGHTNPTIEVVRQLVKRGHDVTYYSFDMFAEKIKDTGARYISCDRFLPDLNAKEMDRIQEVSTSDMSLNAIHTAIAMDGFLKEQISLGKPDLIVSDSVCFWAKLTARKYEIPLVVSTTTFAFNQQSARSLQYSPKEIFRLMVGMPKVQRELKKLKPLGYEVTNVISLVQDDNDTDTIVYAAKAFQPAADTFSPEHYLFAGPSVKDVPVTRQDNTRPFVYISLGSVIASRPDFYRTCIEGLGNEDLDVLIACGKTFDMSKLPPLPANIKAEPFVSQMEVLAKADVFITHCGMNSAAEGLWMGVPEILFPLSGEQRAVADAVERSGAGLRIDEKHPSPAQIKDAVFRLLQEEKWQINARRMRDEFRSCPGPSGAADFIERVYQRNH